MRRDVFQAIADPTRRDIINLIANKSLTPNGVADSFDVSRQAISKHIKILTECGIIVINPVGRERYCYIQAEKLNEVNDWLQNFRQLWEQRFDKLDNLLTKLQAKEVNPVVSGLTKIKKSKSK
ncbi:MAG: metalloregulator ArsR/SmtB family transcription factor [Bacteroidota bacterium]